MLLLQVLLLRHEPRWWERKNWLLGLRLLLVLRLRPLVLRLLVPKLLVGLLLDLRLVLDLSL